MIFRQKLNVDKFLFMQKTSSVSAINFNSRGACVSDLGLSGAELGTKHRSSKSEANQ